MFVRKNIEILKLIHDIALEEPDEEGDPRFLPAKTLLTKFDESRLAGIPIKLKIGAVSYNIGTVQNIKRGREIILGDLYLHFDDGELIFDATEEGIEKIHELRIRIDA